MITLEPHFLHGDVIVNLDSKEVLTFGQVKSAIRSCRVFCVLSKLFINDKNKKQEKRCAI